MNEKKIIASLKNVSKIYQMGTNTVSALSEVSLDLYRGLLTAIMGPSGSGKSTLLHLLGCLDRPSTGEYFLDGCNIACYSDNELSNIRATQIGFVFQSFNLISQYNVYENVEVPFLYRKEKVKNQRERILESIDRVGLSHRLRHLPTELSGGEMQRVAIARALAIDPLLILADEPTGNLDSETGNTILGLFKELTDQGVTIIVVTHDEAVGNHCKRLIRMKDGKIASEDRMKSHAMA